MKETRVSEQEKEKEKEKEKIRLNVGCGGRPLLDYINIDMDTIEELKTRYPHQNFPDGIVIQNYNIFNLPFADGVVDEIRADSLVEHLSFEEEPIFFNEVKRVLRTGGLFQFDTTDFQKIVQLWIDAEDDWKDFYRNDREAIENKHWFGTYSYSTNNRWGYLSAMIFGSQNGAGQFHKNCYTVGKIRKILSRLGFKDPEISFYQWKGDRDPMINVKTLKL